MMIAGSRTESISAFEYFWDRCEALDLWKADMVSVLSNCHLALCAPWTFKAGTGKDTARWLGLVLEQSEEGGFKRRGVFMGPSTDSSLDGWERTTVTLR